MTLKIKFKEEDEIHFLHQNKHCKSIIRGFKYERRPSEPSFTISDIILVWAKAQEITIDNTSYDKIDGGIEPDYSYIEKERNKFFKKQFNIDITKL